MLMLLLQCHRYEAAAAPLLCHALLVLVQCPTAGLLQGFEKEVAAVALALRSSARRAQFAALPPQQPLSGLDLAGMKVRACRCRRQFH